MTTVNKPKHNLDANLLDYLVSVNRTEELSLVHYCAISIFLTLGLA